MERPYVSNAEFNRMTKRELVWYRRRQAAWDLASKLGEVTDESYGEAYSLLNSCKNLALGFASCDEQENEYNWEKIDRKRNKLIERERRLDKKLQPYGCKIDRSWGIEDVFDWDFERHVPTGGGYLHFFD